MDNNAATERLNFAEWQIKKVIEKRKCRPSKAIREVLGSMDDDSLTRLVKLWRDDGFTVDCETTEERMIEAYSNVRSCMTAEAEDCAKAYISAEVIKLVILKDDRGEIKARALYRVDTLEFNKCYGELAHALEVLMKRVMGITHNYCWLSHDGLIEKIGIFECKHERKYIELVPPRYVARYKTKWIMTQAEMDKEMACMYWLDKITRYDATETIVEGESYFWKVEKYEREEMVEGIYVWITTYRKKLSFCPYFDDANR